MTTERVDVNPYGKGVKQRDVVKMTPDEVDAFLREWHIMNVASMNHDGAIHLVAMWYGFLDGAVAFHTKARSQKALNLRRDPRITCLVEEGDEYGELRGVELVGRPELIDDPERLFAVGVSVFERAMHTTYTDDDRAEVEAYLNKRVAVKVHVDRVVSWDHRKLGST
jgi:PPOX class probable F420-dependent enzyme